MKRLVVVTGSRAEYGQLRPFLRLAAESKVFEMRIIPAGMHLLPEYGNTLDEIEQDGYRLGYRVDMYDSFPGGPSGPGAVAWALGVGTCLFASAMKGSERHDGLQPDLVLIPGDRVEALAAALAAAYCGIPIAHCGGGDMSGTIDNAARHAISHFAAVHLVSTDDARDRLIRMGCSAADIHVTGAPGIDAILATEWRPREAVLADLGLPEWARYVLVAFHSESEQVEMAGDWMDNILRAVSEVGPHTHPGCALAVWHTFMAVTYPNSDPGGDAIIETMKEWEAHVFPDMVCFASLGSDRYLHALRYADALVGNSSSGLYEAPSLGVPVVNVGHRQDGRPRAANVLDCTYGAEAIAAALDTVLRDAAWRARAAGAVSPFGDGRAAERMLAVIEGRLGG